MSGLRTWFRTRGGDVHAVDGVDLTVGRGEVLGLVGESGSGKSVTMLSVLRLVDKPGRIVSRQRATSTASTSSASARRSCTRSAATASRWCSSSPTPACTRASTPARQISEVYEIHRNSSRKAGVEKAVEMLRAVGIPDPKRRAKSFPHQLSGGQAQRVMIAMALAAEPELLIADEPTTALDVTIQAQILDLMRKLQAERGTSVVLITHDLGVVAEMAHRVAVMYGGQVVEQAPVADLFANPKHPYTIGLLGSVPVIGSRQEELTQIKGRVPTLIDPQPGCRFADRCPKRVRPVPRRRPRRCRRWSHGGARCVASSTATPSIDDVGRRVQPVGSARRR